MKIKCTKCSGTDVTEHNGYFVCNSCGNVFSDNKNAAENRPTTDVASDDKSLDTMSEKEIYDAVLKADQAKNNPLLASILVIGLISIVTLIVGIALNKIAAVVIGALVLIISIASNFWYNFKRKNLSSGRYINSHCQYCGGSLEGAGFSYKELSVSKPSFTSATSTTLKHNYTYTITCPNCGKLISKKFEATTTTTDDSEQKLMRVIDDIIGPEIAPTEKMITVDKKAIKIKIIISASVCAILLVICLLGMIL